MNIRAWIKEILEEVFIDPLVEDKSKLIRKLETDLTYAVRRLDEVTVERNTLKQKNQQLLEEADKEVARADSLKEFNVDLAMKVRSINEKYTTTIGDLEDTVDTYAKELSAKKRLINDMNEQLKEFAENPSAFWEKKLADAEREVKRAVAFKNKYIEHIRKLEKEHGLPRTNLKTMKVYGDLSPLKIEEE